MAVGILFIRMIQESAHNGKTLFFHSYQCVLGNSGLGRALCVGKSSPSLPQATYPITFLVTDQAVS